MYINYILVDTGLDSRLSKSKFGFCRPMTLDQAGLAGRVWLGRKEISPAGHYPVRGLSRCLINKPIWIKGWLISIILSTTYSDKINLIWTFSKLWLNLQQPFFEFNFRDSTNLQIPLELFFNSNLIIHWKGLKSFRRWNDE